MKIQNYPVVWFLILRNEFDVKYHFFARIIMIMLLNIENAKQMISNACEIDQLYFEFIKFDLISNRACNLGKSSLMTQVYKLSNIYTER